MMRFWCRSTGLRLRDGFEFEMRIEAPIPHSDPETMTQALNDSLAPMIRAAPNQWFWMHRRWKPDRSPRALRRKRPDGARASGNGGAYRDEDDRQGLNITRPRGREDRAMAGALHDHHLQAGRPRAATRR
jgi:hypothetical protein